MGDCRLKISIHNLPTRKETHTLLKAADSTLEELMNDIQNELLPPQFSATRVSLFDLSYHPPREIAHERRVGGFGAATLKTLGWFPSAELSACESSDEEGRRAILEKRNPAGGRRWKG